MEIMPQATYLFAGLLALLYVFLTVNVIRNRRRYRVAIGASEEHPGLVRAVRAHGNFAENTPLFLILLCLAEIQTGSGWACYLLGALFFAGRLAHAYSLLVAEPRGQAAGWPMGKVLRFRFYAMSHTFMPMAVLALILLWEWLSYLAGLVA